MKKYIRDDPSFSLCGLNCCLCPRFHTDGPSKCPGCGGPDFFDKHPSCAVIACGKKNGSVQYCFQCAAYPCKKYASAGEVDSFISYKNVLTNFSEAKKNLKGYLIQLKKRHECLTWLLEHCNEGKSKGLYCLAANLFPLAELSSFVDKQRMNAGKEVSMALRKRAEELGIDLVLRKKKAE